MDTLRGDAQRARLQRGKPHPTAGDKGTEESEDGERAPCAIECAEYEWRSDVSQLLLSLCQALTPSASDLRRPSEFLQNSPGTSSSCQTCCISEIHMPRSWPLSLPCSPNLADLERTLPPGDTPGPRLPEFRRPGSTRRDRAGRGGGWSGWVAGKHGRSWPGIGSGRVSTPERHDRNGARRQSPTPLR